MKSSLWSVLSVPFNTEELYRSPVPPTFNPSEQQNSIDPMRVWYMEFHGIGMYLVGDLAWIDHRASSVDVRLYFESSGFGVTNKATTLKNGSILGYVRVYKNCDLYRIDTNQDILGSFCSKHRFKPQEKG
ncbi:hypothetical protein DSO57_1010944 [Entomophthora muscae]|uniref:Uncharacterized protein n=1 Tax=Entomophthora muscae TaxID=34485 RepID=A0ACC2TH96_9FUNG|nr:hypothetical protein DSO57_1010944 [Entomophthora muscae]